LPLAALVLCLVEAAHGLVLGLAEDLVPAPRDDSRVVQARELALTGQLPQHFLDPLRPLYDQIGLRSYLRRTLVALDADA
jgi:hypothetical protein